MGLKSARCFGASTFWIGRMQACFNWLATIDVVSARLSKLTTGLLMTGAESLRNQAGMLSSSVAVGRSLSRIQNTVYVQWYAAAGPNGLEMSALAKTPCSFRLLI